MSMNILCTFHVFVSVVVFLDLVILQYRIVFVQCFADRNE